MNETENKKMIPNQTPEQFAELIKGALKYDSAEARAWAEGKTLYEAVEQCKRPDWLMWIFQYMRNEDGWPGLNSEILAACDCAKKVLHLTPKKNRHIFRDAIGAASKYVAGEITRDELGAAVDDAITATYDAAPAYNGAAPAYAAYDAACAAYAAATAAYDAARAPYAAPGYAAYYAHSAAAYDAAARRDICDVVRKNLWTPFIQVGENISTSDVLAEMNATRTRGAVLQDADLRGADLDFPVSATKKQKTFTGEKR